MQPPAIKAFVDRVLSTPEDQLADVLEAFVWKADKVVYNGELIMRVV